MAHEDAEPVVPGLLVKTSGGFRMRASRCRRCGTINFPFAPFCPNPACPKDRENVYEHLLKTRGHLWSWSVQHVRAPAPFRYEGDAPYAVGMVDLPDGIRVLGLMSRTSGLSHGMAVELKVRKLYDDEDSREVVTWSWDPLS